MCPVRTTPSTLSDLSITSTTPARSTGRNVIMFHILKTDTDMRDVGDAGAVDIGIDMSVNQSVDVVTQMRAVKVGMQRSP